MIHSIRSSKYYSQYSINSKAHYQINPKYLDKIIAVLNQSKAEMVKPLVSHICIYVTSQVDPSGILERIRRILTRRGIQFNFVYSLERRTRLHIHFMLVMEAQDIADPDHLLLDVLQPAIDARPCVMGSDVNKRLNKDSYFHDLTDTPEFYDAVERYSYFAKTSHKEYVPAHFRKTFNTSTINNPKYFSMDGTTMLKTHLIKQKNNLKLIQDEALINRYNLFKLFENSETETKLCFSIDHLAINKAIGFYGLSYEFDSNQLHLSLDDLYIASDYRATDWLDVVFADIVVQVQQIVSQYPRKAKAQLQVYIYSQEAHIDVADWLEPAVEMACQSLAVNYQIANQALTES